MDNISIIQQAAQMKRKLRNPSHTHYVTARPYQIQPFLIAPVLPGETLKSANLQGRIVTDPLANGAFNIMPWWHEHYFFYVKLRDLPNRADFEAMFLKQTALPGGMTAAAKDATYHAGKTVDYVQQCLDVVTKEYFRNEGETTAPLIDNLPIASAIRHGQNWMDSLIKDTVATPVNNEFMNPEGERDPWASHLEAYERMRATRMIEMSFEEFLAMQGVKGLATEEMNKPELLRYTSSWGYPSNTVDPATGVPSAAFAASVSERIDKDRFFKEPGFIFGVTVLRAKIFAGNQRGSAVSMLTNAYSWLNVLMQDRPETAFQEFVGGADGVATGPLRGQTDGYWVDIEDLFRYGDQFVAGGGALPQNFAPALPDATGDKRFMTSAMINALFLSASVNKYRYDGRTDLHILARPQVVQDAT